MERRYGQKSQLNVKQSFLQFSGQLSNLMVNFDSQKLIFDSQWLILTVDSLFLFRYLIVFYSDRSMVDCPFVACHVLGAI